jgi:hypothetical protein
MGAFTRACRPRLDRGMNRPQKITFGEMHDMGMRDVLIGIEHR